ncbi:MAG TPA: transglutaminase-like domain-containing protein [Actinomycetes bacterium]|nr:transglutaminase-like domain-containing protein [Actinomycetes bacterium]
MTTSRDRFAAVVRNEPVDLGLACALLAVEADPHSDPAATIAALEALADRVPDTGPAPDRLRAVLGQLSGAPDDYDDLESSLLPDVLRRGRGLPILLSVVWLEVAKRVQIPAYGIGLPGHFVVGIGDPDAHRVVLDPFAGGRRLRFTESMRPWEPVEILQRVLANIRAWASPADRWATRRWALELGLLLPRHPLDLRRELADLKIGIGAYLEGAAELEAYADVLAAMDPQRAETIRVQARSARARLN